jgi:hypothetical protein
LFFVFLAVEVTLPVKSRVDLDTDADRAVVRMFSLRHAASEHSEWLCVA